MLIYEKSDKALMDTYGKPDYSDQKVLNYSKGHVLKFQ